MVVRRRAWWKREVMGAVGYGPDVDGEETGRRGEEESGEKGVADAKSINETRAILAIL
jgi:hypothetical protein